MINLAVVGLGYWGRRHVESASASGRFKVIRAVDTDPGNAAVKEFADAHGITLSASIDDALGDAAVDAVTLATPHNLHPGQIRSAAAAGKHVYTEKPFALRKDLAEQSVAACAAADVVLALGHDQRFYPAIIEMKRLIDDGEIGTPLHIETNLSHDAHQMAHRARAASPDMTEADKNRYGASRKPAEWRLDAEQAPTGPLVHFGIHRVDCFIHLFGNVDWVFAAAADRTLDPEVIDTIAVTMKFKRGATGQLGCSLSTPLNSRLQVFGTGGWVEARGPEDPKEYALTSLQSLIHVRGGERRERVYEPVDSVRENFASFADAIEAKAPFMITPEEMIHNAAIMEAVEKSVATKAPVTV
ncbi:MAG: Gfo/Idh/MocA family oxidoreductase [Rhodospirillales bacterium]|jgi:predicted dehydrogenase|nr:Gfo/Idh/MocA family oxidoreductase [Rhodospirillales bacterium]MDP6843839.1 Gfo/Idh/MocA family oxidoreductase [Rhodospirillales bacterium]